MKLDMHARGLPLPRDLKSHIRRRVRFALGRFADRVRRVHVRLEDENGPRGGQDITCKVRAQLHPRGSILIAETRNDPYTAVARAAERVARVVPRKLARKRGRPARA